jgi:hypothetical protein
MGEEHENHDEHCGDGDPDSLRLEHEPPRGNGAIFWGVLVPLVAVALTMVYVVLRGYLALRALTQ